MFSALFKAFGSAGKELYHVGGSVRDTLLNKTPKDYDFTTNALPNETQEILTQSGFKHWPLGEKFGTIATIINNTEVEITTYRKDVTAGRHPEVSSSKSVTVDLERRDFTINSIAMDERGNIVDPFHGVNDLKRGIIRTTGSPRVRFGEDPLRMLRAVRFVSQLGFNLNKSARDTIQSFTHAIMFISRERWLEEMNKLLLGQYVDRALELFYQTRLMNYIIPEMFPITIRKFGSIPSKDLWVHTKIVVKNSEPRVNLRWAALLHDIAKPQTRCEDNNEVHFFQHELLGSEMAYSITKKLKMSNEMSSAVVGLISLHQRIGDVVSRKNDPPVSKSALRRVVRECEDKKCSIDDLIDLFAADCSSRNKHTQERQAAHVKLLKEALIEMREEDLRPKLPKGIGEEIMKRYSLSPGPEVGVIKNRLDQMLLDGIINSNMSLDEMFSILGEV